MSYFRDRSFFFARRYYSNATLYKIDGPIVSENPWKLIRQLTGDKNAFWRQQVKMRINAATAMVGTFDFVTDFPGTVYVIIGDGDHPSDPTLYRNSANGIFGLGNYPLNPTIDPATAINRALIAFLKKVRNEQVKFSSPTFLGELRQTLGMIRRPAEGLTTLAKSYLRDVKNVKKAKPRQWKKNLSGLWLEYAFGWVPLMSDIDSAMKAYNKIVDPVRGPRYIPLTGYGIQALDGGTLRWSPFNVSNCGFVSGFYKIQEKAFVRYRGMVESRVDATTANISEAFGFVPSEFIPTAWELLPWSFLVDYFTNIGDVLTASVAERSRVLWVNQDVVLEKSQEYYLAYDPTASKANFPRFYGGGGVASTGIATRRKVTRNVGVSLGTPQFMFELPTFIGQVANMSALYGQASSGIHPQSPIRRLR